VKFIESVDVGGNRWSKPHVPTAPLHEILAIRDRLSHASMQFDVTDVNSFDDIVGSFHCLHPQQVTYCFVYFIELVIAKLTAERVIINSENEAEVKKLLTQRKKHQFEYASEKKTFKKVILFNTSHFTTVLSQGGHVPKPPKSDDGEGVDSVKKVFKTTYIICLSYSFISPSVIQHSVESSNQTHKQHAS
jgi:hypothetical protein